MSKYSDMDKMLDVLQQLQEEEEANFERDDEEMELTDEQMDNALEQSFMMFEEEQKQ